jgi:hypothetical protein
LAAVSGQPAASLLGQVGHPVTIKAANNGPHRDGNFEIGPGPAVAGFPRPVRTISTPPKRVVAKRDE